MRLLLLAVVAMLGSGCARWGVCDGRLLLLVDRGVCAGAIVDARTGSGCGAASPLWGAPGSAAAVDTVEGVAAQVFQAGGG